jgi:uncharacterized protein YbjT (DUF2867 family)
VARILIVGCGCRGRELAGALVADGHPVRGTSRTEEGRGVMEVAGVEGHVADPDRVGTLLPLLHGVSAVCWLLGSAEGPPEQIEALHGPRLRSLLEKLVDSPVRGLVYEAAGTVDAGMLIGGAAVAEEVGATFRMPVRVVLADPADPTSWTAAMQEAVNEVLEA